MRKRGGLVYICHFTIMSGLRFKSSFLSTVAVFSTWVQLSYFLKVQIEPVISGFIVEQCSWPPESISYQISTVQQTTGKHRFCFSTFLLEPPRRIQKMYKYKCCYLSSTINTINKVLACMPHFFDKVFSAMFSIFYFALSTALIIG